MDGEDIEGVIGTQVELELGGDVAANATDYTEDDSSPGRDVAGSRGDGHETRDGAGAEPDDGPLLLEAIIHQYPGDSTDGGGQVGDNASHDGAEIRGQGGTTVEAEPSDPEEDGAEDDVGDVMRSVRETGGLGVAGALAEHDGEGEGGGTRRDMDGSTTGKVETTKLERPTVRIPCPVGDGIVHDGGPDENKDDAGQDAGAIYSSTDGEGGTLGLGVSTVYSSFSRKCESQRREREKLYSRNGREHALIQAKEKVGNLGAADRGLGEGLHETEVAEIADIGAAGMGEGQTVSPKEPLEVHHGDRQHRQHDEGEGRLPSSQTGVEEPDARNHEKHERGRGDDPGEVTTL